MTTSLRNGPRALVAASPSGPAAAPRPAPAPAPAPTTISAQLIVYESGAPEPRVYEGTATLDQRGSYTLSVPVEEAPPAGTSVQIILYEPGRTVVREGTTTAPAADGSFEIILRDG